MRVHCHCCLFFWVENHKQKLWKSHIKTMFKLNRVHIALMALHFKVLAGHQAVFFQALLDFHSGESWP